MFAGLTGDRALVWIIPTAEFPYPAEQDEIFRDVIASAIGVQPFMGGGALYNKLNGLWRNLPPCPLSDPGCDDPLEPKGKNFSKYTNTQVDLTSIAYATYYADALLSFVYAFDDLIRNKVALCHRERDNPCAKNGDGCQQCTTDTVWNNTCVAETACAEALRQRLFSLNELELTGLTGPLVFDNRTQDRVLQYEVRNWRVLSNGGSKFLSKYDQVTRTFTPGLGALAAQGDILFNGGKGYHTRQCWPISSILRCSLQNKDTI